MTITEALAQLTQAWPTSSFSIGLDVWSHVHDDGRQPPAVQWSIYHAETRRSYDHPTLDGAVALVAGLPPLTLLRQADAAVEGL